MNKKAFLYRQLPLAAATGFILFSASPGTGLPSMIAFFGLLPLLFALEGAETTGRAALLGLIAGLAWYIPLLHWITIVLGTYGYMARPLVISALLLLALYMSCYPALFAALTFRWRKRTGGFLFFSPLLWVGLDYLRSFLFSGFPWQDLGYTQYRSTWLIQVADLGGHHAVTWLLVLCNCLLFSILRPVSGREQHRWILMRRLGNFPMIAAICLLLAAAVYNSWRQDEIGKIEKRSESLPVAVVQASIEQDQKWRPDTKQQTVRSYLRLSSEALAALPGSLLVWPETALPFTAEGHPLTRQLILPFLKKHKTELLTGAPYHRYDRKLRREVLYNRALLLGTDAPVPPHYDKQHLVPFGEYIPLRRLLPAVSPVVETMMDFMPGEHPEPISCRNIRIGVLICFESIFPELARNHAVNGAGLLVNMTNDAWFGKSLAPEQHFSMAVFRAVENRRSLARAANTGISGFIDPTGHIVDMSPIFKEIYLTASLPIVTEKTLFMTAGWAFAPACLLLSILLSALQPWLPAGNPIAEEFRKEK